MKKYLIPFLLCLASFAGYSQSPNSFGGVALRVNDTTTYQTNAAAFHTAGYYDIYFNNQATNDHWDVWNGSSYDHIFAFGQGSGGVTSVSGTSNRITSTGGATPVIDISSSYVGQSSITTLGTIATGTVPGTLVSNTPAGNIAATTAQAALNELDGDKWNVTGTTTVSSPTINMGAANIVMNINSNSATGTGLEIQQDGLDVNGADFNLYNRRLGMVNADRIFEIHGYANNSAGAGTKIQYWGMGAEVKDFTSGSEEGRFIMNISHRPANVEFLFAEPNAFAAGVDVTLGGGNAANGLSMMQFVNNNAGTAAVAEIRVTDNKVGTASDAIRISRLGDGFTTTGMYRQAGAAIQSAANLTGGLSIAAGGTTADLRLYTGGTADANKRVEMDETGATAFTSTATSSAFVVDATLGAATSEQIALRIGGITKFAVRDNGQFTMNPTSGTINTGAGLIFSTSASQNTLYDLATVVNTTNSVTGLRNTFGNYVWSSANGQSVVGINSTGTFNAAGGTTSAVSFFANPTYNTTSAYVGVAVGFLMKPVLTSVVGLDIHGVRIDEPTARSGFGAGIDPTAKVHAGASTTAAKTASLKIDEGSRQTAPENGTINYVANNLEFVETSTVYTLAKTLTATATLNFDLTAVNYEDLTITVTGAVDGDAVVVGVPNAAAVADITFFGWVSSANTVTIRAGRVGGGGAADPASGTFRASVVKY